MTTLHDEGDGNASRLEDGAMPMKDRVLGAVGIGMLALALVLLIVAGARAVDGGPTVDEPGQLVLITPEHGASASRPLELMFSAAGAEVLPGATGWGANGFHLHVEVDGVDRMPAMDDIRRVGDRYVWALKDVPVGEATLRLLWSDSRHRPVPAGASETVTVTIQ